MSDYQHYKGKLIPCELKSEETVCDFSLRILTEKGITEFEDDVIKQLTHEFYEEFILIEDDLYRIEAEKLEATGDVYNAHRTTKGNIKFEVLFYNGAQGLNDAIIEAVENI